MLTRGGRAGVRVAVAVLVACLAGYVLTRAVAPIGSTTLDGFVFLVAIAIGFFVGDATRPRGPRR